MLLAKKRGFILFITSLLLLFSTTACRDKKPAFNYSFLAFGTLIDLTIVNTTHSEAVKAADLIEKNFHRQHKQWHAWQQGELKNINKLIAESKPAKVPQEMIPLIKEGMRLSKETQGFFNPAIGKLIELWGFHGNINIIKEPPSPGAISYLLKKSPSMADLTLNGDKLSSQNNAVQLDFGGYGKGYGVDLAIEELRRLGIDNAIVNAGGDLHAIGSRGGTPWKIAIRRPSGAGVLATVNIRQNESVFTSGDYERFFMYKKQKYHHIIDPRTGYPTTETKSVTVIHTDSITADAAATALFIAGPDEWYPLAKAMGIKYVALVDKNNVLHVNPAMKERLNLLNKKVEMKVSKPLFIKKSLYERR